MRIYTPYIYTAYIYAVYFGWLAVSVSVYVYIRFGGVYIYGDIYVYIRLFPYIYGYKYGFADG